MFFYTENLMKFAFSSEMPEKDVFESGYAIMGVPFDGTTSYKSGSRYGPKAVREASYTSCIPADSASCCPAFSWSAAENLKRSPDRGSG